MLSCVCRSAPHTKRYGVFSWEASKSCWDESAQIVVEKQKVLVALRCPSRDCGYITGVCNLAVQYLRHSRHCLFPELNTFFDVCATNYNMLAKSDSWTVHRKGCHACSTALPGSYALVFICCQCRATCSVST